MKPRIKPPAPKRERLADPHNIRDPDLALDPLFEGHADYLVRMIRIREIRAIDILLSSLDLSLSSWYPLAVLRELDGMSQRELGGRLNLKDAAIGKAVDAMEKAGLVQRMVGEDRRKALVYLTDKGKIVAEEVATKRRQLLDAMTNGFTQAESRKFSDLLQRCFVNLACFVDERGD